MKKHLLLLGWILLLVTDASAHFRFGGRVPQKVGIIANATHRAKSLDLVNGGRVKVAHTKEYSNSTWGYKVRISSRNGFNLVHKRNGQFSRVPYGIKYRLSAPFVTINRHVLPLAAGRPKVFHIGHESLEGTNSVDLTNQGFQGVALSRFGGLFIETEAQVEEDLLAGAHKDRITFTIEAKERPRRFRH